MACDRFRDKLDAYVDGELSSSEAQSVGTHLRTCAECAADALDRVQMKRSVALAGNAYRPTNDFRKKIQQSIKAPAPRGTSWGWKLVTLPAALVLILSLTFLFFVNRERERREQVFGELADLHVATMASATPVDVISTDRHTVKPWFEGKIPFTFNLPELQGTDFSLVGGRVTYLEQNPGAQLIYRIRRHEVSVFIFQDRATGTAAWAADPLSQLSFTFETWAKNGLRYFVVGDVGAADVESLSKLLRDAG